MHQSRLGSNCPRPRPLARHMLASPPVPTEEAKDGHRQEAPCHAVQGNKASTCAGWGRQQGRAHCAGALTSTPQSSRCRETKPLWPWPLDPALLSQGLGRGRPEPEIRLNSWSVNWCSSATENSTHAHTIHNPSAFPLCPPRTVFL